MKKRKKRNVLSILGVTVIMGMVCTFFVLSFFSKQISPILMSYAEAETRKLTTLVINKAVTKQIASDMNTDDLFTISKNDAGEIQLIDFNSITVTKILSAITSLVQLNLKAIEEGNIDLLELPDDALSEYDDRLLKQGIIYEIPIGTITNSSLLSNLGPKIPLKLDLIGDVVTGIETNVTEYGINNALLEVGVNVTVTSRINLPFLSEKSEVSTVVPIAMKVIQGKIPEIYANGFRTNTGLVHQPVD